MAKRGLDLADALPTYNPSSGRNHLLVIGIDDYLHWPKLHNAVRDAQSFARLLCQQYQFEETEVTYLFNEAASEGGIYRAIRELKRKVGPNDNLVLYYSGHGHYDEEFDEGYWVPYNAGKNAEETYISNANILKRVNALDGHHLLLIIDSCFSGSLLTTTRNAQVDEHFPSRRVLCSGRLEAVSDGQPGKHSPFAELLIARLRDNTAPSLNTTALVQHIKEHIPKRSQQAPVDGRLQNSSDRGGEFIFHLKVSEAELWQRVEKEGSAQAYEAYLNDYPQGRFAAQAGQRLLALREESIWKSALQKDSELAYRNYLKQYAGSGQYLAEAEQRLRSLEERHRERQQVLEKLSQQDAEREKIQQQFLKLVNEAETRFQQQQMETARDRYRESLQYYMAGFAPTYEYLEQQINLCSNGINFMQYLDNGKTAMERGNYRLALQYFNEAARHGDDPKLEDLIRVCRQRLNRPAPAPKPEPAPAKPQQASASYATAAPQRGSTAVVAPARQKGNALGTALKWIGGLAIVFIILAVIGSLLPEEETGAAYVPDPAEQYLQPPTTAQETAPARVPEPEPEPAPAQTYQQRILGNWAVDDILISGQSYSELAGEYNDLSQYTYTFRRNGQATISSVNGTEQQAYSIEGQQIYIYSSVWGGSPGVIDYMDDEGMRLTFYVADGYGGTVPMVVTFDRK